MYPSPMMKIYRRSSREIQITSFTVTMWAFCKVRNAFYFVRRVWSRSPRRCETRRHGPSAGPQHALLRQSETSGAAVQHVTPKRPALTPPPGLPARRCSTWAGCQGSCLDVVLSGHRAAPALGDRFAAERC